MTPRIRIVRHKVTQQISVAEYRDGSWHFTECAGIDEAKATKERLLANANRRERHVMMTDLGLTRVRGALGGTYYE